MRRAPAAPRRADEDGNAPLPRGLEDHGEIALERAPVGEGHARSQIVRPRIRRSRVHRDGVGIPLHSFGEGAHGDPIAQHPLGSEDGHTVVGRGRGAHVSSQETACSISGTCCWAPYTSLSPRAPEPSGLRRVIFTAYAGSNSMIFSTSSAMTP